jgi:alpha-L-arabinofuranosidase
MSADSFFFPNNMKHFLLGILFASPFLSLAVHADTPDKGWLKPYVNGRGLAFEFSSDSLHWKVLGGGRTFVDSDFGTWGAEKKMADPCLFVNDEGLWTLMWIPNPRYNQYAICTSPDLIHWKPQDYPPLTDEARRTMEVNRQQTIRVPWRLIESLRIRCEYLDARDKRNAETLLDDDTRFAGLQPFGIRLTFDPTSGKEISDKLIGVFFEDISWGADGGLYAELIQNRDFEYSPDDVMGRNPAWGPLYAWSTDKATAEIDTQEPIHPHNPHYARITAHEAGATFSNTGYDGIPLKKGEDYRLSFFGKKPAGAGTTKLIVSLQDAEGKRIASANVRITSDRWQKKELTLKATADVPDARLVIESTQPQTFCLDMVSLFPCHTFKGHRNGLRADLAQAIADLHPKFVRFPGGCVAHGDGLHNMYLWKNTIGPLEERIPTPNIWRYHQTLGLGYMEYFQFCEDIGAEPLPVVPAGVPCQNSSWGGPGQQGGLPFASTLRMNEDIEPTLTMEQYTQDILDLIEWANGDARTTKWGRVRAQGGHPKPFGLKYLGIGNEDLISEVFTERFTYIYNKVKERYPDIIVCGTVGPFFEGSDYTWGWQLATDLGVPMVDEHYYISPGWFINNQDFYDHYDRNKPKVYLGEYASHTRGRRNCMESALTEGLYILNLERNGDVVVMTSYAPLLCREGHRNWDPDLIYFNGTDIRLTPGYYVQQMCGQNSGDRYISGTLAADGLRLSGDVRKRLAYSCVTDSKSGDVIVKMANLLPVEVSTDLDLSTLPIHENSRAVITTLSGQPTDVQALPLTTTQSLSDTTLRCTLPSYSFTVVRISREP